MKDFILSRTPDKYLPKSKVTSQREKVCKIDKDGPIVYILYVNITNIFPISANENKLGFSKYDYAGIFQKWTDADYVADCLNKIFKWYHVYNDQYKLSSPYGVTKINNYYVVDGFYTMIGAVRRKQFLNEQILTVVTDKNDLQRQKELWAQKLPTMIRGMLTRTYPHSEDMYHKLYAEPTIHVMQYRLNDVMATMNLKDYNILQHKKHLKKITNELYKYPHNKAMKQLIGELEYMPPTPALKTGGVKYQDLTNDPEFKKRWTQTK